jgi:hypothetical protein
MRHNLLLSILLATLATSAVTARATDVRGRVDGPNPNTQAMGPLAGVGVALFTESNGTFTLVHQTVTGSDGMYYFTSISPGQYVLQVAGVNYQVAVASGQTQDVPAIIRR